MGLFDKLSFGLKKTKGGIFGSITKAISGSMIDDDMYEDLLDQLILADVGYETSQYLVDELERRVKKEKVKTGPEALELMKQIITELLSAETEMDYSKKPTVILIIGVNGVGKLLPSANWQTCTNSRATKFCWQQAIHSVQQLQAS